MKSEEKNTEEKIDQKLLQKQAIWQLAFAPLIVLLMLVIGSAFDIEPDRVWIFPSIVAAGLPLVRGFKLPGWWIFVALALMASTTFRIGLTHGGQVLTLSGLVFFIFGTLVITASVMRLVSFLFGSEKKRPMVLGGILLVIYGIVGVGFATDGFRPNRMKKGPPMIDTAEPIETKVEPEAEKPKEFDWSSGRLPPGVYAIESALDISTVRTKFPVYGTGEIIQITEDNVGDKHQKILVRIENGKEYLIWHRLDNHEKLPVDASGELTFLATFIVKSSGSGGVITISSKQFNGWIEWNGKRY